MARQHISNDQGWSHCPICKHWVPQEYFICEYDKVEHVLTRMCFNCAHDLGDEDLPTFKHEPFRYDPLHGTIKCPLCGKKHQDTKEYNSKAKRGDPDFHRCHCGNPDCNKDFIYFG